MFPDSSAGKESACNAGDPSSSPGLGRSAGEGMGYPLPYSGLENSMDCIVYGATKSQRQLGNFHFQSHTHTHICTYIHMGFPGGSDGKASVCNAGDPGSIPG